MCDVRCEYGCGFAGTSERIYYHELACSRRPVKCATCEVLVDPLYLEHHANHECVLVCDGDGRDDPHEREEITTPDTSSPEYKFHVELEDVMGFSCVSQITRPATYCGKKLRGAVQLAAHQASECPDMIVLCPDCGAEIKRKRLGAHRRTVSCMGAVVEIPELRVRNTQAELRRILPFIIAENTQEKFLHVMEKSIPLLGSDRGEACSVTRYVTVTLPGTKEYVCLLRLTAVLNTVEMQCSRLRVENLWSAPDIPFSCAKVAIRNVSLMSQIDVCVRPTLAPQVILDTEESFYVPLMITGGVVSSETRVVLTPYTPARITSHTPELLGREFVCCDRQLQQTEKQAAMASEMCKSMVMLSRMSRENYEFRTLALPYTEAENLSWAGFVHDVHDRIVYPACKRCWRSTSWDYDTFLK